MPTSSICLPHPQTKAYSKQQQPYVSISSLLFPASERERQQTNTTKYSLLSIRHTQRLIESVRSSTYTKTKKKKEEAKRKRSETPPTHPPTHPFLLLSLWFFGYLSSSSSSSSSFFTSLYFFFLPPPSTVSLSAFNPFPAKLIGLSLP